MRITIIHGQNHKGSTYHTAKILIESLSYEKEIQEFFLPKDLHHFCMGCYACIEDETKCPYFDEKNKIMNAVEKSDVLILTSPNYCMAPTAPMKSFMDLTFTYWFPHKPRQCMFNKRAVVISTTAGVGTKYAIKPITKMLFYWGISYVKNYGIAVAAMSWKDVKEKKKAKIRKDMAKLALKLSNSKKVKISFRTKFMFMMMSRMQKGNLGSSPREKQYWEEQGWLDGVKPWKG